MPNIQLFEYQPVTYKGKHAHSDFQKEHLHAFESYFQQNEQTPYFELIPLGVRFKSYVGVIQIGNLVIEVLPKADRQKQSKANKNTWQDILLDMLRTCHLLRAKKSSQANLKLKRNSILELYFVLYLEELEALIKKGLIKKYHQHQSQQKTLKGCLIFSEQIRQNLVHKERFFVRHQTYDKEHLLHQILHEALLLIQNLDGGRHLKDRIGRLVLNFPDLKSLKVKPQHFESIPNNRKHAPYERALEIAKLLLLNFRPDLKAGKQNMIALMFDMNQLWEEYIYRVLKRELSSDWLIEGQSRQRFWEKKQIRPDIVLKHKKSGKIYVIDTKWKIPEKQKPSDNDLKQMFAYNHYWNCTHSLLLYPAEQESKFQGSYSKQIFIDDQLRDHYCSMGFLDLVGYIQNRRHRNLFQPILNMLNIPSQ